MRSCFRATASAFIVTLALCAPASALTFQFEQAGLDVVMNTFGSVDLSGLVLAPISGWGSVGIENNSTTDIRGNTTGNSMDASYGFNSGTDLSAWQGADGPFSSGFFNWTVSGDNKSFTTYFSNPVLTPGFGVVSSEVVGTVWSSNQVWTASNTTLARLGLDLGEYTITDAVSGEFVSIIVEQSVPQVPVPAAGFLLGSAIGLMGLRRMAKKGMTGPV